MNFAFQEASAGLKKSGYSYSLVHPINSIRKSMSTFDAIHERRAVKHFDPAYQFTK